MLTADAAAAGLWDQHVLLPIAVGEFQIRINSTPEKSGVVSPKILGALHPSAPSSPSPFSLFSKTEKIRTSYRPTFEIYHYSRVANSVTG